MSKLSVAEFYQRLQLRAYPQLDLSGWVDEHLQEVVHGALAGKIGPVWALEVGSWKGLSASILGKILQDRQDGSTLLCMDTWLGSPEFYTWGIDDPDRQVGPLSTYQTFLTNMQRLGLMKTVVPFPISSDQGFEVLKYYGATFDLAYIDGSHEWAAVTRDIHNAWELLNAGGTIVGDDYDWHWQGVIDAVKEMSSAYNTPLKINGIVWSMTKP